MTGNDRRILIIDHSKHCGATQGTEEVAYNDAELSRHYR